MIDDEGLQKNKPRTGEDARGLIRGNALWSYSTLHEQLLAAGACGVGAAHQGHVTFISARGCEGNLAIGRTFPPSVRIA